MGAGLPHKCTVQAALISAAEMQSAQLHAAASLG